MARGIDLEGVTVWQTMLGLLVGLSVLGLVAALGWVLVWLLRALVG